MVELGPFGLRLRISRSSLPRARMSRRSSYSEQSGLESENGRAVPWASSHRALVTRTGSSMRWTTICPMSSAACAFAAR